MEQDDEWAVGKRYFSQESMARLRNQEADLRQPYLMLAQAS